MQRLCRLILMLVVLLLIGAYIQKPEYIIYSIISGSGGDTRDTELFVIVYQPWDTDGTVTEIVRKHCTMNGTPNRLTIHLYAAMQGADRESVCRIMQCLNTTEALKIIRQLGILEPVMASVMDRIDFYLSGRAGGEFEIGAIMFSNEDGILEKTPNAEQLLERIQNERKQK